MTGRKTIPKTKRMDTITEKLPNGDFAKAVLEKHIRDTKVGTAEDMDKGIKSPQSIREYIGLLLDAGMIEKRKKNMYRVTEMAKTPGKIEVEVKSQLKVPLVRDLLERALAGIDGVTIIDEVV